VAPFHRQAGDRLQHLIKNPQIPFSQIVASGSARHPQLQIAPDAGEAMARRTEQQAAPRRTGHSFDKPLTQPRFPALNVSRRARGPATCDSDRSGARSIRDCTARIGAAFVSDGLNASVFRMLAFCGGSRSTHGMPGAQQVR